MWRNPLIILGALLLALAGTMAGLLWTLHQLSELAPK